MAKIVIIGNQGFSLLNFRGSLIAELCSNGHEVVALAADLPDDIRKQVVALGASAHQIDLARTGINLLNDIKSLCALYSVLRREKPDIILAYAIKPVIYGTIAAWLARVPRRFAMIEGLGYVFIDRAKLGLKTALLRYGVKKLYRFSLARTEAVLFLNEDDRDDFASMGLVRRGKALLIGAIGVDLDRWSPVPQVMRPITFTLVSRLLRDKGILEFVAAARRIKMQNASVRFILVGGLDSNPESISASEAEGWVEEGIIEWPGHTDVAPYLEMSSVFVLPSYREGLPRSTQEAMAMARAVITTDAPGCRDTVVEGVNGFRVPVQDAEALADAMQRFIDNPDLIVEMGRESRRLAEERFDFRHANQRVIKALKI